MENKAIVDPCISTSILTQEEKENVHLIKKFMSEQETILPSLRYEDWKK